jgi:hypothetical protein
MRASYRLLSLACFALALALPGASAILAACSSSEPPAAPIGPLAALGAPCDGTLTNPCAPAATGCSANVCTSGVCTQILVSGDPSCGDAGSLPPTNSLCASNADCEAGVCGFLAGAGCSVTGVCVAPELDASLPSAACGCNGSPDPYVASGFVAAPASSPGACVDGGGVDAAADGADDASDAATGDAATAGDASDSGDAQALDAAVDAGSVSDGASE